MNNNNPMRISMTVFMVFILSTCMNFVNAQQTPTNELLVGTWTFLENASVDKMPLDIKQELQNSSGLQNHIASFYTGRQMIFYANGTFSIIFPNGSIVNGQWNVSGNALTTLSNDGSSATQQIVFLDANHFVLIAEEFSNPDARVMFPELHFIRS